MQIFDTEIINNIGKRLLNCGETIAVAESVTSGLLQAALSSAKDAIHFYQGGITAYNVAQKYKHLCVEPIHAISVNCVSQKVASEMAMNVCRLFSSDWGIGITGYASAVPESDNTVFAFYAIVCKTQVVLAGKIEPVPGNPFDMQVLYANETLTQLAKVFATSAVVTA